MSLLIELKKVLTTNKHDKPIKGPPTAVVIWYLTGSVFVLALLAILIIRFRNRAISLHRPQHVPASSTSFFAQRPAYRIGAIGPLPNRSALFLEQGMSESLQHSPNARYQIVPYHGDNNRVTLFNQAVTALQECDVIVPFGLACTNIVYEAARHTGIEKPIIFTGIKSCHISLLREQNPKENLVGIISKRDHLTQLSQLIAIKPAMTGVLIVYRQQLEWILQEVEDIVGQLARRDLKTFTHLLPHSTHIANQLSTIKQPFDTIMVMPRTLNSKGLQEMITYCNIKGITLVVNDLDGVTLGAAIGFGGEEVGMGVRAGKAIRDLLEINKPLVQERIIEHIDHYQVHLNQRTLEQQGVLLPQALLFLLKQGEISHLVSEQSSQTTSAQSDTLGNMSTYATTNTPSTINKLFAPRGFI